MVHSLPLFYSPNWRFSQCMTTDSKAPSRVCIFNFHMGGVVCDQLVQPPSSITDYLTHFSGITAATLARMLADIQTHLHTLILPWTILLGHSLELDTNAIKCHLCCIDTALIFRHLHGRPLKLGLAQLTRKWLRHIIQITGLAGTTPKRTYVHVKAKIKNGVSLAYFSCYLEPILVRIACSHSCNSMADTRAAIVNHGNPSAWNSTSATAPPTVACTNIAEVLNAHHRDHAKGGQPSQRRESRKPNLVGEAQTKKESSESRPDDNSNTLFTAVTNLNDHLTTLHAALPPRTTLLLFSEHSDPRLTSTLAKCRAYSSSVVATGSEGSTVHWSMAGDRAIKEAVVRAQLGLLFVGVKP
ncbi:hypothetical protein V8E53_000685 [Lactarius tabidus]